MASVRCAFGWLVLKTVLQPQGHIGPEGYGVKRTARCAAAAATHSGEAHNASTILRISDSFPDGR
jgi:hypothetical protein